MPKLDWADQIIANQIRRYGLARYLDAKTLRQQVNDQCDHNIHTWGAKWSKEKREKERKKELKRLIQLNKDRDNQDEFVFEYSKKGIVIIATYDAKPKIGSVQLKFSDDIWADLMNRHGQHLGQCCANISRIRDLLQDALRDDGFINTDDLWEIAHLAKDHGFIKDKSPIGTIISLWETIKKDVGKLPHSSSSDLENPQDALNTLCKSGRIICFNEIISHTTDEQKFQRDVNNERALCTVMACVRTLYFKLQQLSLNTIKGYGVYDGDKIGESYGGVAIYKTQEMAQEVCDMWNKEQQSTIKKRRRHYTVHPCQVTMTHGVEKL